MKQLRNFKAKARSAITSQQVSLVEKSNGNNGELWRIAKESTILALEVVESALDGVMVPGLQGAISSLLVILRRIDSSKINAARLEQLKYHIDHLREDIINPAFHPRDGVEIPTELKNSVAKCFGDLENKWIDWDRRSQRGAFLRAVDADSDRDDLGMFSESIKQGIERFLTKGSFDTQLSLARIEDNNRWRLVNELPRAKGAGCESRYAASIATCFDGTRAEVLETISEWMDDPEKSNVLWLSGLAGTGKSTIARTIIEHAVGHNVLGASFFFSRDNVELRDGSLLFPTLAHQFAMLHPVIRGALAETLREEADSAYSTLNKQLEKLIVGPLRAFDKSGHTVVVILDALDECESRKDAAQILQLLLSNAFNVPHNLRILVTSRPENHIESIFSTLRNHDKVVLHDVDITVVQADIHLFLRHELNSAFDKYQLPRPDDKDVDLLSKSAGKLFIYAATVLRFIDDDDVGNPTDQLRIVLSSSQDSEANIYSAVDELYLQVLHNAALTKDKRIEKWIRQVTRTIVTLRNPISISSLARFVELEQGHVDSALRRLHSVILVPSSQDEAPRVFHQSFVDFMTNKERCTDSRFFADVADCDAAHARRCLELISDSLQRNMIGLSDHTQLNSEVEDLDDKVKRAYPDELGYACLYWVPHILGMKVADEAVVSLLDKFLSDKLLIWIESMSLLGSIPSAILMMRDAYEWALKMGCSEKITQLLYDSYRCLFQYRDGLMICALNIYYSVIQFIPQSSVLYKTYGGTDSAVRVSYGIQEHWSPCLSVIEFAAKTRITEGEAYFPLLAFSPDGSLLATAAECCAIGLWNGLTGAHAMTLEYRCETRSLAFLPDSTHLISGSDGGSILLWNVVIGGLVRTVNAHGDWVVSLSASSTKPLVASASEDGTVRVWDTQSWKCLDVLNCNSDLRSVSFYPDGEKLVFGSRDGCVAVWDATTSQQIKSFQMQSDVTDVAVSSDGKWLAVTCYHDPGTISVFDTTTFGAPVWTECVKCARSVSVSPDGLQLVSSSDDPENEIRMWGMASGKYIKSYKHKFVMPALFSPDGSHIVSADVLGTCRFWDPQLFSVEVDIDEAIWGMKFSVDGSKLAVGWAGGKIEMRDTSIWNCIWSTITCVEYPWRFAFSPDAPLIACKDVEETEIVFLDVETGRRRNNEDATFTRFTYDTSYDHVHWKREMNDDECAMCKSSELTDSEYWFTKSDQWIWQVERQMRRRIFHIPAEHNVQEIRHCSGHIALACTGGMLLTVEL